MATTWGTLALGPLSHSPMVVDDFTSTAARGGASKGRSAGVEWNPAHRSFTYEVDALRDATKWGTGGAKKKKIFFLTHAHEDHMRGLSSSWRGGRVVCTPTTAALVKQRFPGFDESLFRVVGVGESVMVWFDEDGGARSDEDGVAVTALDAKHVPGSAMFLLQWKDAVVLHTGDFRCEEAEDMALEVLERTGGRGVDVLYVDNTYGTETSPSAPPRGVVLAELVERVCTFPDDTRFFVAVDTLGKEEMLEALARALRTKVVVTSEERWERLTSVLGDFVDVRLFTRDEDKGRVVVVGRSDVVEEKDGVVHVVVTGWVGSSPKAVDGPCVRVVEGGEGGGAGAKRVLAPYSLHSSLRELREFVDALNPRFVVPTVMADAASARVLGRELPPPGMVWGGSSPSQGASFQGASSQAQAGGRRVMALMPQLENRVDVVEVRRRLRRRKKLGGALDVRVREGSSSSSSSPCTCVVAAVSSTTSPMWTDAEDAILNEMRRAFVANDVARHDELRERLRGRTDGECVERMTRALSS